MHFNINWVDCHILVVQKVHFCSKSFLSEIIFWKKIVILYAFDLVGSCDRLYNLYKKYSLLATNTNLNEIAWRHSHTVLCRFPWSWHEICYMNVWINDTLRRYKHLNQRRGATICIFQSTAQCDGMRCSSHISLTSNSFIVIAILMTRFRG